MLYNQKPYDPDKNDTAIFNYLKNNAPFRDYEIDMYKEAFIAGAKSGWISGSDLNPWAGVVGFNDYSSELQGNNESPIVNNVKKYVWIGLGFYGIYLTMPYLIKKVFKKTK